MDVGDRLYIPRILGHVVDQNRLPGLCRLPCYPLANLDSAPLGKFRWIADLKAETQFLGLFVEQKNCEDLIVDHFADDFGDAAHSRIQIKRSGQHVGNIEQQRLDWQAIRFGNDRTHWSYDSSRARHYSRGTTQMSARFRYFSA